METADLTFTLTVDQTPQQVFNAIKDPRAWWTGEFTGTSDKLGDEFTYRYEDVHYSKLKVTEFVPGEKLVWLATESQLNFIEDKEEWTGTRVIFKIDEVDGKTQLRFTHEGIKPKVECYEACSGAWGQLVQQSLYSLITTGKAEMITFE